VSLRALEGGTNDLFTNLVEDRMLDRDFGGMGRRLGVGGTDRGTAFGTFPVISTLAAEGDRYVLQLWVDTSEVGHGRLWRDGTRMIAETLSTDGGSTPTIPMGAGALSVSTLGRSATLESILVTER